MYLLDVCGHGVGAALLSISVINVLRSQSLHVDFRDPGQVLAVLNDVYQMEDHNDMFFTIWYGIYNRKRRDIVFASAGHPPAIAMVGELPETAEIVLLDSRGVVIGAMAGITYKNARFELKLFSKLWIYSDGAYEITRPDGTLWTLDEFVQTVSALPYKKASSVHNIMKEIKKLQGSDMFDDDVSLVEVDLSRDAISSFSRDKSYP